MAITRSKTGIEKRNWYSWVRAADTYSRDTTRFSFFLHRYRLNPKRARRDPTTSDWQPTERTPRCAFCSDNHFTSNCTKVTTTQEGKKIVIQKQLCFNCLGNHQVATCRSRRRCSRCNRKHHTSICDQQEVVPASSTNQDPKALNFVPAPAPGGSKPSSRDATLQVFHSTTQPRFWVLLKTAVAKVTSGIYTVDANIWFDEGAQRSFVTRDLANKLQLQTSGTAEVQLAAFGSSSKKVSHIDTATIYLLTDSREEKAIDVLIVPTIAVPLGNRQRDAVSLPYLRELKLAHPLTAATLQTSRGLITSRPTVKLYPLEVLLTFSFWPGGCRDNDRTWRKPRRCTQGANVDVTLWHSGKRLSRRHIRNYSHIL